MLGKKGKQLATVFLIDFGLIKRYKDPKTNKHIPFRDNKGLIGTARYVSINTHIGLGNLSKNRNKFYRRD